MISRKWLMSAWLVSLATALPAAADVGHEPHRNILQTATTFIEAEARQVHDARFDLSVRPGRLDSRLRLRSCEKDLEAFLAPGSRMAGNSTVGVRCPGPTTWMLYVPVEIVVEGEVVVLAQPLPRGTVLDASHLRLERQDISRLASGYLTDPGQAHHMVLRRPLQAGTVLNPGMVEPPRMVHRGQRVQLLAENESVAVRAEGEALGNGARGERVRVRNLSSRRVVEGIVLSHGVVGVSM